MSRPSFWFSLLLAVLMITGITNAGTITGKINFQGAKPSVPMLRMDADRKCLAMHAGKTVPSQQVTINSNNTLKDVFVYVKKGLEGKKFPTPSQKVTIAQEGCMYHPHVFGIMVNQPLEIVNDDATLHNIHALPKNSSQFNVAQPMKGMKITKTFDKPEVMVKIKCEVHNWMAAYAGVLDHPFYAVTDDKGNFTIKDLPAGTYEIEAWQEKYGPKTMTVTVGPSDTKTVDFTYEGK